MTEDTKRLTIEISNPLGIVTQYANSYNVVAGVRGELILQLFLEHMKTDEKLEYNIGSEVEQVSGEDGGDNSTTSLRILVAQVAMQNDFAVKLFKTLKEIAEGHGKLSEGRENGEI